MGHARALLGTPDRAFQEQLAKRAIDDDLSVRCGRGGDPGARDRRARRGRRIPRRVTLRRAAAGSAAGPARARGAARRPPRHAGQGQHGGVKRARSSSSSRLSRTSSGSTASSIEGGPERLVCTREESCDPRRSGGARRRPRAGRLRRWPCASSGPRVTTRRTPSTSSPAAGSQITAAICVSRSTA